MQREFRLLGDAHFAYQFNRTWRAQASYSRTFESVPGLRQPVYADGFTAVIDGFLSYRWDVVASASFSDGESALVRSGSFDTYAGNVRVRYALSRAWALYGEYCTTTTIFAERRSCRWVFLLFLSETAPESG